MSFYSRDKEILVVVISDIVAMLVALYVFDKSLEVEICQLVLNVKHDVIHEFIINLWGASKDHEIASVLWEASIHDSVVYIVSLHDCALEPLIVAIADEALAGLKVFGAVHLSMTTIVASESLILTNCVLKEGAASISLRV